MSNHQPVGTWRFLTPLETIQPGDLGRYKNGETYLDRNWTQIDSDTNWIIRGKEFNVIGTQPPELWEFIRPVDGTIVVDDNDD